MKVRLFTYHFSDNYGALYQAWALREWFIKNGHDASFVNYHPRYVEEGGDFDQLFNLKKFKKNLIIAYMKLNHHYRKLFGDKQQQQAFTDFCHDQLGVAGQRLFSAEQLAGKIDADLLVCGSDQIWNPSIQKGLDPVYFLSFPGAENARRISYAPSFGRGSLPEEHQAEAGRLIKELDGISVREASGIDIVKQVSGREAVCVPDPTILLGDFSRLIGDSKKNSSTAHVFCYALRTDERIRDVAEAISNSLGVALISPVSSSQRWKPIGKGVRPGPIEWLQQLNAADFVVSNSFHGVALSIIQNKPFVAVGLPGKKASMNERVLNLLHSVCLQHRLIQSVNPSEINALINHPVDWFSVNEKLHTMRSLGESFINEQLKLLQQRD